MTNFYTDEACEAGVLQSNENEIRLVAGGEFGDVVMTVSKDDAQAVTTVLALWADMVAEDAFVVDVQEDEDEDDNESLGLLRQVTVSYQNCVGYSTETYEILEVLEVFLDMVAPTWRENPAAEWQLADFQCATRPEWLALVAAAQAQQARGYADWLSRVGLDQSMTRTGTNAQL